MTLLPHPTFRESARCLDTRRLGQQRLLVKRLLLALGVPVGRQRPGPSPLAARPAAAMWRGHETALAFYGETVCREWCGRGCRDRLLPQFRGAYFWLQGRWDDVRLRYAVGVSGDAVPTYPNWIGCDVFHRSHRAHLLRLDAAHYGQFGWKEPPDLPVFWPVDTEAAA